MQRHAASDCEVNIVHTSTAYCIPVPCSRPVTQPAGPVSTHSAYISIGISNIAAKNRVQSRPCRHNNTRSVTSLLWKCSQIHPFKITFQDYFALR